jgi:hypothetical protein
MALSKQETGLIQEYFADKPVKKAYLFGSYARDTQVKGTSIKEKYPDIEWNNIIGFRNISIHEYFGVNFHIVWQISQNDLPVLKAQFLNVLNELK